MKTIQFIAAIIITTLFSCEMPVQEPVQQSSNLNQVETPAQQKNAAWYRSKGYQVFNQYNLAIKTPVRLENLASQSRERHDFNYGGLADSRSESRQAFYQVIINNFPATYRNLPESEKAAFEEDMLKAIPEDAKEISLEGHRAFVYTYRHNNMRAKSLMLFKNGRTYGFNLITNNNLDGKFEELLKSIHFIEE